MTVKILSSIEEAILGVVIFVLILLLIYYLITLFVSFKAIKKFAKRNDSITGKKLGSKWLPYKEILEKNLEEFKNHSQEEVEIMGVKNAKLKGTLFKPIKETKKVILFAHGWRNTGLSDLSCTGYFLLDDYYLLAIDHYAHGRSEGKYISFGAYDSLNILRWVDFLNQKFDHQCEIYLYGISMGATSVLMTADQNMENVQGIIADSGFSDGYQLFKEVISRETKISKDIIAFNERILIKILAGYDIKKCSTLNHLTNSKYPILFMHGDKDNFVVLEHAINNYNVCTSPKQIVIFDNCTHIIAGMKESEKYQNIIIAFLEKKC